MAKRKTKKTSSRKRARGKKITGKSVGLLALEMQSESPPPVVIELERQIREDGGSVLCAYREPFGGHWLLLSALPVELVEPTPYQRDLSEPHMARLMDVITRIGRFLDPIVAVRSQTRQYWTPNGFHRLAAMKNLGARSIPAVVIPERSSAYQILALNTEKAHNLREKALEVIRMYRELSRLDGRSEEDFSLEFEEPAFLTLGLCYEARPRFSGGAYHPLLRRSDHFRKEPLGRALEHRQKLAQRLLAIDDIVNDKVKRLKDRGLMSPYLKSFVMARVNPLRFKPRGSSVPPLPDVLTQVGEALKKFDPERIKPEHLARASGPIDTTE